jgi:hypothetical protein
MKFDSKSYRLTEDSRVGQIALIIGIIGLVLTATGYFVDKTQFYHSYLTAFFFWLSIALGGLFFTMLHHLVGAIWSVVLRRLAENIMICIPLLAIFLIPVLFGIGELFHWSHPEAVAQDHLLQSKAPYLNVSFFIIRAVFYFVIWVLLARYLLRLSLAQDGGHTESISKKMRVASAPGMILFALTVTFASFDWLMSLDAHWYSTIFGVYVFSGSLLAMLAFLMRFVLYLDGTDTLRGIITREHWHDMGKLIFAFTVFWGYMAFSQYFLIWYGNIPEETVWFLHRWEHGWQYISLFIVFGHFVIPFFVLFPYSTKRSRPVMLVMTIWILAMHWVDLYWIVMPNLHREAVKFSWIDFAPMLGIGGIFIWFFWSRVRVTPLLPAGDPGLEESKRLVSH